MVGHILWQHKTTYRCIPISPQTLEPKLPLALSPSYNLNAPTRVTSPHYWTRQQDLSKWAIKESLWFYDFAMWENIVFLTLYTHGCLNLSF